MTDQQQTLAELLKLKSMLVSKYSSHTFVIQIQDMIDRVNLIIDTIQQHDQSH